MSSNIADENRPEFYLWGDLETTGSLDTSQILEYYFVVTDTSPLLDEVCSVGGLIYFPTDQRHTLNPVVQQMHTDNELWLDLADCNNHMDVNEFLADVRISNAIFDGFNSIEADNPRLIFAGSGVSHFDSLVIKDRLPLTWSLLDGFDDSDFLKPTMDMGVIRRFLTRSGLPVGLPMELPRAETFLHTTPKPHRAEYDTRLFMHQYRWLCTRLNTMYQNSESYWELIDEKNISRSE